MLPLVLSHEPFDPNELRYGLSSGDGRGFAEGVGLGVGIGLA